VVRDYRQIMGTGRGSIMERKILFPGIGSSTMTIKKTSPREQGQATEQQNPACQTVQ